MNWTNEITNDPHIDQARAYSKELKTSLKQLASVARYRAKHRVAGLCINCTKPRWRTESPFCLTHREAHNAFYRKTP